MTTVSHDPAESVRRRSRPDEDAGDSTLVDLALAAAPPWPQVSGVEVPWTERGDAASTLATAIRMHARSLNNAERAELAAELATAGW